VTVLKELSGEDDPVLTVVTLAFSESFPTLDDPDPTLGQFTPGASYWRSFPTDVSEPWDSDVVWFNLFVSQTRLTDDKFAGVLMRVAVDDADPVIVAAPDAVWLYHPYDGGADVIAPDTSTRDALRAAHPNWLSRLPSGL